MRSRFDFAPSFSLLLALLVLPGSLGCEDGMGVATVAGRFASRAESKSSRHLKSGLDPRIVDSEQTSLAGLSVTMEVWRTPGAIPPEEFESSLRLDEVLGTKVPDADGRFVFEEVPAVLRERGHPSWGGYMFVRIQQDSDSPVRYGESAQIKHVWGDETLTLSIPLVSRYLMPSWFSHSPTNPAVGPLLTAHAGRSLLFYLNPAAGVGLFDPVGSRVSFLKMENALDFAWHPDRLDVLEAVDKAIVSMVHETPGMPLQSARFVLVDLSVLIDKPGSVVLDADAEHADEATAQAIVVIDAEPTGTSDHPVWRVMDGETSFHPRSFVTTRGSRYYQGRWGSTFVLDLQAGTFVEALHDNGILGAYNPDLDHLYFDLPDAVLRIRLGSTGEIVADADLGARRLLAAAALPGESKTMVSYESAQRPLEHRVALVGSDGAILEDHLAGDFLGYTDRNWNRTYDWGTCSSFFYRTPDCPECPDDPPADIFMAHGDTQLPRLTYTFDEARSQLVADDYGLRFQYEDGQFHPLPASYCGSFAPTSLASDCDGHPIYDLGSGAVVLLTTTGICVNHLEAPDLLVNVEVERLPEAFALPAVLPSVGTAYMPGLEGITAVHYRNPDAVDLPALRDLRALHE